MPRAKPPPPPATPVEAPHVQVNMQPPVKPYIVFVDTEGTAHFMEFDAVHLYCVCGRHHVQDRFGRHFEVMGAYDIQDPGPALHSYQMLCAGALAMHTAREKKEFGK